VSRLKQTWRMLPLEYLTYYEQLVTLSSSDNHHKNLVAAIKSATLPALPYLGMYLTWLTFIEGKKTIFERF
jgi:son of sevenless-like protein